MKFGQTTPSHTAVADLLPDEPGGYAGFQAVFGHKYLHAAAGPGGEFRREPRRQRAQLPGDGRVRAT